MVAELRGEFEWMGTEGLLAVAAAGTDAAAVAVAGKAVAATAASPVSTSTATTGP